MPLRSFLLAIVAIASLIMIGGALSGLPRSFAAEVPWVVPDWLQTHVGEGEGQIAPVVLQRARALYLKKVSEGAVNNPCYFAMDATRPGGLGRRFYVICETNRTFRAVPSGHGSGRDLEGIANFANGIRCAKNFSNAMDSKLTTGGPYVTAEIRTSFKGYYRVSEGKSVALMRSFVQFDGEGDAANARPRAIGGHPAVVLTELCLRKAPGNPYADHEGYVPFGQLVDYSAGRSNGCTSWSPSDAERILALVKDQPTTLYIYPEIDRHRRRNASGEGRSVAVARGTILERFLLERNWLSELLAEGNSRTGPRSIQERSPALAAAAAADLQMMLELARTGHARWLTERRFLTPAGAPCACAWDVAAYFRRLLS